MKTDDQNDLKLGTVVVLDTVLKAIDLGVQKVMGQGYDVIRRHRFASLQSAISF